MEAQLARLELPAVCCWTGRVAAWAPFSSLQQPASGLPPLKTAAQGLWLRSEQGGVLMVRCSGSSVPPLLTFTLRSSQQLVRAPLCPGGFSFRLLCPTHGAPPPTAGGSSGHVLFLAVRAGVGSRDHSSCGSSLSGSSAGRLFAVHFDTMQAGLECGSLLQAIQHGSLALHTPPVLHAAAQPAAMAADAHAAAAPHQGGRAAGSADQDAALFGYEDDSSLIEAIRVRGRGEFI